MRYITYHALGSGSRLALAYFESDIYSPCIKLKIFQPLDHAPIALRVLYALILVSCLSRTA